MTRFLALPALALSVLAAPAGAAPIQNARVNVQFIDTGNVVEAFVTVTSVYGFRLQGWVDVVVGAEVRKLGPVDTATYQILSAPIVPSGSAFTGCALFAGRALAVGDAFAPAQAQDCRVFDPALDLTRVGRPDPGSRLRARSLDSVPSMPVAPRPTVRVAERALSPRR